MALFTVKTSKKTEIIAKVEESTATMLDRYAHFHKASAEDVVNEALEYIFKHDKDFQQDLTANPTAEVQSTVRFRKVAAPAKRAKNTGPASSTAPASAK